jgi:hypothetical protein
MLHVAHVDVDPADVVDAAAGFLDRRLEVLADLPRLRLDVADAGNRAVGPPRRHAGDEAMRPRASTMVAWENGRTAGGFSTR